MKRKTFGIIILMSSFFLAIPSAKAGGPFSQDPEKQQLYNMIVNLKVDLQESNNKIDQLSQELAEFKKATNAYKVGVDSMKQVWKKIHQMDYVLTKLHGSVKPLLLHIAVDGIDTEGLEDDVLYIVSDHVVVEGDLSVRGNLMVDPYYESMMGSIPGLPYNWLDLIGRLWNLEIQIFGQVQVGK